MQVMPRPASDIAKKFGFAFDRNRMLSDAVYNAQMGAAELGDLLEAIAAPTSSPSPATTPAAAA